MKQLALFQVAKAMNPTLTSYRLLYSYYLASENVCLIIFDSFTRGHVFSYLLLQGANPTPP